MVIYICFHNYVKIIVFGLFFIVAFFSEEEPVLESLWNLDEALR